MIDTVAQATSREELLGFEGDAARRYFAGLRLGFTGAIGFDGRARRPPPDPANALLSFGYVLLANVLASLLEACGFDPYLGFMHSGPFWAAEFGPRSSRGTAASGRGSLCVAGVQSGPTAAGTF